MSTAKPAHSPWPLWLGYVIFVIYGSLVPLRYVDRTFDDAWAAFQNIPFLHLGVASRADWISNGVLYVPVGFLTAYLIAQTFQKLPRFILYVPALAFSVALALGVEFTQLYFPQRTVSLNDILAECIGSVLGILLAARYAGWFKALVESFLNDSTRLKTLALDAYAFAYIALALFPYDFFISRAELSAKINSDSWGWLVAGTSHSLVMVGIQLFAEAALALPFGLLLARLVSTRRANYIQAALAGLLLGMGIELVQFFMAAGISQGLSVLTRVVGVCGGLALSQHAAAWQPTHITYWVKRLTPAIAMVYALALLQINGFITLHWGGLADAKARFDQINFTPFYYHYFTSEAKALFSLSVVALSYVPIAVLTWARGQSARVATAIALAVCTCIELGKLFLTGTHADPSNLLIASAVSWFTVRLLQQLIPSVSEQDFGHDAKTAKLDRVPAIEAIAMPAPFSTTLLRSAPNWLWFCLISAAVWAISFPAFPVFVTAVLAACAALVWRKPVWVFAVIPAALPIFDLATWSGRFFLDEFDAVLFVGLAVAYARVPATKQTRGPSDPIFRILAWLVAASFAIAALRGMLPFQWPNANSFNTYYSPYNALRIVKGAVWAWLAFGLSKRFAQTGVDIRRPFAWGMTAGLTMTVAYIIWERIAFSGLWNFTSTYRVTGPFSAIHVGGAYIECLLATATPFLIALMLEKRSWLTRLVGTAILLATTYTLMVTFSRNGFSSFAVGVFIVLLGALLNSKRVFRAGFIYAAIVGAMLMVALPIYKGDFAQSRMATISADLDVRAAHWQDAMAIRDPDWLTTAFGMGLGRYPETAYWRSTANPRSGTYTLIRDTDNTYLRLAGGDSIYVEQIVKVEAGADYILKFDVRPSVPNSQITLPICEKLMLTSFNCIWLSFNLGPEFGAWRSIEKRFNAKELSTSPWYSQRPIKLSIYYGGAHSTIDVDNISLQTQQGTRILSNGDFSQGLDRWFYSSDGHLQWHIKSLFYGVLFDQGWFGLIATALLFSLAIGRATQKTWRGDILGASMLAATMSFLTVGLFDTLIDSPRFLMLILMFCFIGASKAATVAPNKHGLT
jgi:glycopeptide antibiotics resistance protein